MLYEIYSIKHYFFRIFNEKISLMSQNRHTPTTWMISWVVTSDKPFLNVGVDICVKIFGFNFIRERVSVGEE